jgi:hypothetical protein
MPTRRRQGRPAAEARRRATKGETIRRAAGEPGPSPAFGKPLEGDAAAVPLDDPVDDREAEPGTVAGCAPGRRARRRGAAARVVEALAGIADREQRGAGAPGRRSRRR